MQKFGIKILSLGIALGLGLGFSAVTIDSAKAWEPKKPVEFIIMAGKGGGADKLSRFIQGLIEKNKFASKPFVPINKKGGTGAEALRYLKDHAGDPHVIMATLNSYYTTPLQNPGLGVDISKFTPIARLAEDTFQLWVRRDSGIHTVDEYVKAVKAAGPGNWKMGGTGKGSEDSRVTIMLEKKFGIKVTYIPYRGGSTVAKELIGKHIDSTVNNPSEQLGFWDAGKSLPLASFTPTGKVKGKWGSILTFEELGYGTDMVYYMQRSIIAPPDIPADVQAYYVGVFEKVYKTKEWQDYMLNKGLIPGWLTGDALTKYFAEEYEKHRKLLKAEGAIK